MYFYVVIGLYNYNRYSSQFPSLLLSCYRVVESYNLVIQFMVQVHGECTT